MEKKRNLFGKNIIFFSQIFTSPNLFMLNIWNTTMTIKVSIQGISYWNWLYELTLTNRNMQARLYLKVVLKSWGADIWVLSTSFWKNNISWPLQPPTEKVQISVKIWIFWWSIQPKKTSIGDLVARGYPTIRSSNFFDEMRL